MKGIVILRASEYMNMFKRFKFSIADFLLSFILIALPLSIKATNYLLVALVAYAIFISKRQAYRHLLSKDQRTLLIVNIVPFLFIVLSLSYSTSVHAGLKGIEKYLPLLAFPFIFSALQSRKDENFFVRLFAVIVLIMVAVCTGYALFNFFFKPAEAQLAVGDNYSQIISKWNALSNTSLMQPFAINPIYMSLYVSFALFIFSFDTKLPASTRTIVAICLIAFQFLISSRIGLCALLISAVVYSFLFKEKVERYYKKISVALIAICLASLLLILYNPIVKKRLVEDLNKFELPEDVSGWNGINIRNAIWGCSFDLFKKSPLIGYGVGSQYEAREACYQHYSFYGPFGEQLNCHNQYLEYSLIGGLVLLSLFLLQLYISFREGFRKIDRLQIMFLMLFAITCLGESLLETHKGIILFAFFNSLFLFKRRLST